MSIEPAPSSDGARRPPARRALWVAALFCSGLCLAHTHLHAPAWALASGAGLAAALALLRPGFTRRITLALAVVLFAAAWYTWRIHEIPPHRLRAALTHDPALVTIRGVVQTPPRTEPAQRGRFAPWSWGAEITRFELDARHLIDNQGIAHARRGRLWVRLDGPTDRIAPGDLIEVTAWARALDPPRLPGEMDLRLYAAQRHIDGALSGADAASVRILHPATGADTLRRIRANAHARAAAWLHRDPTASAVDAEVRAVLSALLFGQRSDEASDVSETMTRLGLAHILAISGLHLGILAAFVALLIRLTGEHPRLEPFALMLIVLAYVLILPARAPIIRAAAMILAFTLTEITGRRYDRLTILAWVMIGVLLWRPLELWSVGFQLSFGVVAALLTFAEPFHVRLFGLRPLRDTIGPWRAGLEKLKTACSASLCAWLAASPLIAYHLGIVSPWAAPGTLIVMPPVTLALALGYITSAVSLASPQAAEALAPGAFAATEFAISIVNTLDRAPAGVVYLPRISLPLTLAWLMVMTRWMTSGRLRHPPTLVATLILLTWTALALRPASLPDDIRLRLDTLAVGDGSCHVIRSGSDALLYDCGGAFFALGERDLPRALRALGAHHIPTVIISHANLDHYLALPDIIERAGVRRVHVSETLLTAASDPDGPVHLLLSELRRHHVEIMTLTAGDTLILGDARISVLSPPAGATWRRANDSSLVILCEVDTDGGPRRLLMTGDIETEAMIHLEETVPTLRADVMEAPHHGSARPAAYEFVTRLDPSVVVQSTGPRRLGDERWDHVKVGRAWHTTAGEGSIHVLFHANGELSSGPTLP